MHKAQRPHEAVNRISALSRPIRSPTHLIKPVCLQLDFADRYVSYPTAIRPATFPADKTAIKTALSESDIPRKSTYAFWLVCVNLQLVSRRNLFVHYMVKRRME